MQLSYGSTSSKLSDAVFQCLENVLPRISTERSPRIFVETICCNCDAILRFLDMAQMRNLYSNSRLMIENNGSMFDSVGIRSSI